MADTEIERIISLARYTNYAALFPVLLYLPIGLLLGLIRLCIFIHICLLSYILPSSFPLKRVILRAMLSVTGLPIAVHGALSTDVKKKILVSNHVTSLDPFILDFLHPDILVLESAGYSKSLLEPCRTFEIPADRNRQDIISMIKEKVTGSEETLLFFPEKSKTNGKASLLKFSHLPFELDCPIQPITIQTNRFFFDFAVSTYSSSAYEDLMWCLILPITLFKIKYLPVTERKRDETREEFEHRFQTNMAKSLGLTMSCYDHHDVTEYLKKKSNVIQGKHRERLETQTSPDVQIQAQVKVDTSDAEIDQMLRQVKEVLPETPAECIISELSESYCLFLLSSHRL
ncbi:unnamed protein product [Candidula unifasciata]|uniref:Phospholipid/glycerol acyltransferase domain-containing protein n=1 Tax=Candidula unifasciata TaxID=100452 RepID=A0A8S3YMG3_9EUPU|nr:unnamed protein product [Candidula unifasciata]